MDRHSAAAHVMKMKREKKTEKLQNCRAWQKQCASAMPGRTSVSLVYWIGYQVRKPAKLIG